MPMVPPSGSLGSRVFEVAKLAFGAAARQLALLERGDAGGIVAAIFQPLERIDHQRRDRLTADNSNYAAHVD